MTPSALPPVIAFVGFGEAGAAFMEGFPRHAAQWRGWDIKLADPEQGADMAGRMRSRGVEPAQGNAQAVAGAGAVFSLVTADQAAAAAEETAQGLAPGAFFLDCNSCSPGTKRASAAIIDQAGGRYVDVAVMAPVHPRGARTPLLVSGPHAADALAALAPLGLNARIAGDEVGRASATKMVRSIVMKGLEAIVAECVLAGSRAGVIDEVMASLDATYPGFDWKAKAGYMLERMLAHGARRAAEMREVARTVEELGLPPRMAEATAEWQDAIAGIAAGGVPARVAPYHELAADILAAWQEEER